MPQKNRYAEAFTTAMQDTGTRNTAIVACLGNRIAASDVSNWRVGRRPIPAEHAPAIAALLNIPPEQISPAYERMLLAGVAAHAVTSGHPSVATAGHALIDRLEGFGHLEGASRIVMPEFLVRPRTGILPMSSIRWTLQPSTAMEPEIRRNALILLDVTATQHTHVVDGGTYAYTLWGRPDIRQIHVRKNSWSLSHAGSSGNHTIVAESDLSHLCIFGAVVGWINPP